ncbi:MAG: DUF2382 domain-containing protein [Sinobacteraceae bacterium]|nr:DUF2382 domain-containing protein [Nevskiaceae bacterium]MBV9913981.1 DUF2382 domain-containing protein [Nevskiaceae bacterium]
MSNPDTPESTQETVIPLVSEHATVEKRLTQIGKVRIRSLVDEKLVRVAEVVERDEVSIERIAINQEVTEVPQPREENGVLIVPIVEEVVVVEKRLFLKEEIHVHRNRKQERVDEAVRLKSMRAEVERLDSAESETAAERPERQGQKLRLRRKEPLTPRRK